MSNSIIEVVNTNVSVPFTNANNYDLSIRTAAASQQILIGNGGTSNVISGITLSNNMVGINNSNPTFPLHVNGSINYTNYAFCFILGARVALTAGNPIPFNVANSNYSYTTITANGFRAPVSGYYYISTNLTLYTTNNSTFRGAILRSSNLNTSNLGFNDYLTNTETVGLINAERIYTLAYNEQCSLTVYCNSNDYIRVFVTPNVPSGFSTYDWGATSSFPMCTLTGCLLSAV
jgi:hypothetical protein